MRERTPTSSSRSSARWRTTTPRAGSTTTDRRGAPAGDPDIFILSNLNNVGSVEVNAFQVHSAAVLQKSIREGFGLTVTEALWKGRPTVAGRVGGIVAQIQDGETGYLVDSVEECAEAALADPRRPGRGTCHGASRQGVRPTQLPHAAAPARLARAFQRPLRQRRRPCRSSSTAAALGLERARPSRVSA